MPACGGVEVNPRRDGRTWVLPISANDERGPVHLIPQGRGMVPAACGREINADFARPAKPRVHKFCVACKRAR